MKNTNFAFSNGFNQKQTLSNNSIKLNWKKTSLWLPFLLLSIIMVIIPLISVFIITLTPVENNSINDNWNILNATVFKKIGKSLLIAVISTIMCVLIAYPFCYFLSQAKNKWLKRVIFLIVTTPMWLGSMIVLVSLKLFLDKINGSINSTYGDIYTIIGIVYLYIPYMVIPLYNCMEQLPKNLIDASRDLGRNQLYTFFRVVVPYTKYALLAGISLVLLPAMSVVAVPQFLNNDPNGSLIGDIIMEQGQQASDSKIALARVCVLCVVVSVIMFFIYGAIVLTPHVLNKIMVIKTRKGIKNEK